MGIFLGNTTVNEIENILGIKFTQADKEFMESTHSDKADGFGPNEWHGYGIPETLIFGSYTAMKKFQAILKGYEVKGSLVVRFLDTDFRKYLKEQELEIDGYPKYLVYSNAFDSYCFHFMKLIKINNKTLVYRKYVTEMGYYKDVVGETNIDITLNDYILPNFDYDDKVEVNEFNKIKIRKEELKCEHAVVLEDTWDNDSSIIADIFTHESTIKRNYNLKKWDKDYIHQMSKAHRNELRKLMK